VKRPPWLGSRAALAACLLTVSLEAALDFAESAEGSTKGGAIGGRLSSTLGEDSLAMRFALEAGHSCLGLGLDASEKGSFFEGCLRAGDDRGEGPWLIAGPGRSSGSLRFLADPSTPTALRPGAPVELDESLDSRSAVLAFRDGPVSLFAIGEGKGPLSFASRNAPEKRSPGAAAGGLSLSAERSEYRIEAMAAASYAKASSPITGWKPDPYKAPALAPSDSSSPIAQTALLAERSNEASGALVAVSGSYGELAGTAGALRLQAREAAGDLELRLRAAAAQSGYRALFGEPEQRLAGAAAELLFAMGRSSSLAASVEAEAEGQGLRYAPKWGGSKSLRLVLPLSMLSYRFLESSFAAKRSAEGESRGSSTLAVKSGEVESGGASTLGATLDWERKFQDLALFLSTDLAAEGGLPSVGLDLELELFDDCAASSPVLARGGIAVAVPCGESGSLRLDVDLPESGARLEPRLGAGAAPAGAGSVDPVLSLRYKASFGSSRRRPRSRSSTGQKASSIARRAAS
jgi:hypothetical protein